MISVSVRIAVFVAIACTVFPRVASAHQTSVKYVTATVSGATVDVELRASPADVAELMHLAPDAKPAIDDVVRSSAVVGPAIARWIDVVGDGNPCARTTAAVAAAHDPRFISVSWRATCDVPIAMLTLDFTGFFAVDTRHQAIVRVLTPHGDPYEVAVRAEDPPLNLSVGAAPPSSWLAWIRIGMGHIYDGRDHISFVLALLLVVGLRRNDDGTWASRSLGASLRATATIVTAFTIAHSLTLIAAALGWLRLPSQFVECAIATSIAYTAIENIVRPNVRWRYLLTFCFGLVHGLGFASVLADILPKEHIIAPLLEFNLGVEIGQLTIVIVALPMLLGVIKWAGPNRYRRWVMPVLSSAIAILGLLWLVERLFGVRIIGF